MGVTRINEFRAKEGMGEALAELIESFLPAIKSSKGCHSCRLLVGQEILERIVVVEEWESVAAHQAATRAIPPEALQKAMEWLAAPPSGDYFRSAVDPKD